ncbi:MAG TPA: class I SAM-dependent methyltransferase, partial [Blastocatellia bacterium]|nr:class I SAM-dependent methyltransferase [Blastocatellia bacterium]
PSDSSYTVDFVYLLREGDEPPRAVQDRHIFGLFPQADWLRLLAEVGFEARAVPIALNEANLESYQAFVGVRPMRGLRAA